MSLLSEKERAEIRKEAEEHVFQFWNRFVDIINRKLTSLQFPPELMENLKDIAPGDIVVRVKEISSSSYYRVSPISAHIIHVEYGFYVVLEGVWVRRMDEGFAFRFPAVHHFELRRQSGGEWRWVHKEADVGGWEVVSNIGKGSIEPSPFSSNLVASPYILGKWLSPTDEERYLDSEIICFIASIILLLSSSVAEKLRNLFSVAMQSVTVGLKMLSDSTWQFQVQKEGTQKTVYAFIHRVIVPERPSDVELAVTTGGQQDEFAVSFRSMRAEWENIKLVVEFFTERGESIGILKIYALARVLINLAKSPKEVDVQLWMGITSVDSDYVPEAYETLLTFEDFQELPLLPYIDPRHPKFLAMVQKCLQHIVDDYVKPYVEEDEDMEDVNIDVDVEDDVDEDIEEDDDWI